MREPGDVDAVQQWMHSQIGIAGRFPDSDTELENDDHSHADGHGHYQHHHLLGTKAQGRLEKNLEE